MGLVVYETNYPVLHEISIVNCLFYFNYFKNLPLIYMKIIIYYKVQDLISTMHFYEMGRIVSFPEFFFHWEGLYFRMVVSHIKGVWLSFQATKQLICRCHKKLSDLEDHFYLTSVKT